MDELRKAIKIGCWQTIHKLDILSWYYLYLKQKYYAGDAQVSDARFDEYETNLKAYDPRNPIFDQVGIMYSTCKCCKDKTPS